eukprot:CAMPEP_0113709334 /NCGR_PEP_ID=MMETSP0038_2-20120614/29507_1 /TAXON_ID=2898 /ORGANISM="Cryptomonas paramecium" /LENGTH=81 /DNA_ID=CAMNT_0000635195 /DNA_START=313 /DNA_END=555 /DNA_ORIENTATION=+ /assembly_acc=CAM_ASM_000170
MDPQFWEESYSEQQHSDLVADARLQGRSELINDLGGRPVTIRTADGAQILGLYFSARGEDSGPTVIRLNGNGEAAELTPPG